MNHLDGSDAYVSSPISEQLFAHIQAVVAKLEFQPTKMLIACNIYDLRIETLAATADDKIYSLQCYESTNTCEKHNKRSTVDPQEAFKHRH